MWKDIWIGMLLLSFIMFVISIVLVFVWNIPGIIDELSGRKAKRQIKLLHELNSSTSTFDKLSTNEIYVGISSGTLLNEELSNIDSVEEVRTLGVSSDEDDYEVPTSYLNEEVEAPTDYLNDEVEEKTAYLDEDEEVATSYLEETEDCNTKCETELNAKLSVTIRVIEEQSSL